MCKANSDDSTFTVLFDFGFLSFFFYKNLKNKREGIYKIQLIYVTARI